RQRDRLVRQPAGRSRRSGTTRASFRYHRHPGWGWRLYTQRGDPSRRSARPTRCDIRRRRSAARRPRLAAEPGSMIGESRRRCVGVSAFVFLALLMLPVKHVLEASMTAQMLLQIPLLVGVGCLLSRALPARAQAAADDWNDRGITGLVLASVAGAFWMLPRMLDAAVTEPLIDAAKYLSVPLLIGVPFAISWPRMTFIVRGVFLVEFIATLFRLGWLYLISPERLCNVYLLDDQQRLGRYMLLIGAALFLAFAAKLIFGRFDSLVAPQPTSPSATR